ncbi:lipid II flippase Amj family protein [Paenibacillus silvae]|uniref:lipid II flippase Amj family protein n=1 Tax=Paenibacillus silvae TaxID=1325358 RepID=UPI003CF13359
MLSISLALPMLFTMLIHAADSLSYALRLGGLRTRRIALAISLAGILLLVSRTSNMAQGPMIGSLVDTAARGANPHFAAQLHWLMGAATIGTAIAIFCFPTMVKLSSRMVVHFEAAGSIPGMVRNLLKRSKIRNAAYYITPPSWQMAKRLVQHGMPRRLMLLNVAVTAIYTTGVLSSLYSAYLYPAQAVAASQSTGLINGMATILLTILIDPRISLLSDRSIRGEIRLDRMNQIYGCMLISRLFGTMVAQVLLIPLAYWIGWIVSMM